MENRNLVNDAYLLCKDQYKNKKFSFNEVWNKLVKQKKLSKAEQEENIGSLYTEFLQDQRFIYAGSNSWRLREFATQEEIKNLQNSLYDFSPDVMEEGYDSTNVPEVEDDLDNDQKNMDMDEDEQEVYEDMNQDMSKMSEDEDEED